MKQLNFHCRPLQPSIQLHCTSLLSVDLLFILLWKLTVDCFSLVSPLNEKCVKRKYMYVYFAGLVNCGILRNGPWDKVATLAWYRVVFGIESLFPVEQQIWTSKSLELSFVAFEQSDGLHFDLFIMYLFLARWPLPSCAGIRRMLFTRHLHCKLNWNQLLITYYSIDRAVFNWVLKVISHLVWFCITTFWDWFTKLPPLSQPTGIQNKTNHVFNAHVFLRLAPVTCICFECWLGHCVVYVCCD